jgi:hypothetical protein
MFSSEIYKEVLDSTKQLFDELAKGPTAWNTPAAALHRAMVRQFLEFQICMLKEYQKILETQVSKDSMGEMGRQMARSFMLAYINSFKSGKEIRAKFLESNIEVIKKYTPVLEDVLEKLKEQER